MKQVNMDARLVDLERKCNFLELEQYKFHAFDSTRLYKENANDAKVLVKYIQCLFTRFVAHQSVISDWVLSFRVFSNEFANSLGQLID